MSANLITPDNVSNELLKNVCAAYVDTHVDEDGYLLLLGDCQTYVTITPDKSAVRLTTLFRIREDVGMDARLAAANRINDDYIMVKAHCSDDGKLVFSYYFMLTGGLTHNALVRGVKLFDSIPRSAINEHAQDMII
ncbi:MAG TPA: YbjN domain-containing protein [Geobacteraceae bacterium]|nr:YbjN domain-containing protein [Geobacteraceae bacterium]